MTRSSQAYMETGDAREPLGFAESDGNERLPVADDLNAIAQTQATALRLSIPPNYLERARAVYTPLDAPKKFIELAAGIPMFLDLLKDESCNTPERETFARNELAACVDGALTELVATTSLEINQVSALALEVRTLAPDAFDAWVGLQFTVGRQLAMVTAKRSASDLPRERFIGARLAQGYLVAGTVSGVQSQLERFVGIARLTLEADLNVTAVQDQMELDMALDDYIMARQISSMAQSYISPSGPCAKDLAEGLKLITQAKTFDRSFQKTIDRMRLRNRRGPRTVQLAVEKRITLSVDSGAEEHGKRMVV